LRDQKDVTRQVELVTEGKLEWLLKQASASVCRATLAQLRRGVGRAPGEIPDLWGILLQDMPEEMQGYGSTASYQENAIYTALTLFAVHQQGWDPQSQPMHRRNSSLGGAVARLITPGDEDSRNRVERRFSRAATASDIAEFSHHLRGLVQLLGAQGIPLDWARLAGQIFAYQNPERVARVRLCWGEEFYAAINREKDENNEEDKTV